jgi:hypothetical protein
MNRTTIEHFNNYLKLFINDVSTILPEYTEDLNLYYSEFLGLEICNDDKYVKRFIRKTQEHKELISNRNPVLFETDINIIKTINFKELWQKEISESNRNKIWEYIQTLFVLGETIISDTDRVKKLVENIKNVSDPENTQTTEQDTSEDKELLDMIKNLSNNTNSDTNIDDEFIDNSLIGNLAKELSNELDMSNMNIDPENTNNVGDVFSNLLSGDNPMKFMNLIQTVGDKINNKVSSGDLDQQDLINEAGKMMGALGGNNPMFGNMFKNMNQQQPSQQPPSTNPTRERLKKKLEKKNSNK